MLLDLRPQTDELSVKGGLFFRREGRHGGAAVDTRPVTKLAGKHRADAGKTGIDTLLHGGSFFQQNTLHPLRSDGIKGHLVMHRRRHVSPPRKNFTHRADLMGNVLDAVDDHSRVIEKDDVAVLAHDLNDQLLLTQISQLIEMFDGYLHDSFHARLAHPRDPSVADMLPQQHAKIRRGQRVRLIIRRKIDQRQTGAGRQQQPVRFLLILYNQQQLIGLRLINFIDTPAGKQTIHIINNIGNDNSVKSHIYSSCENCGARYIS